MRRSLPILPATALNRRRSRLRWTAVCLLALGCQQCPEPGPPWVVHRVPHDPAVFAGSAIYGVRNGVAVGMRLNQATAYPVAWRYTNGGQTWTLAWTGTDPGVFSDVADIAGKYVALGVGDPWVSDDGNSWTRVPLSDSPRRVWSMLHLISAGKVLLIGSVGDGAQFWVSPDRVTWTAAPEQTSLGVHTTGNPESLVARDAAWDGSTIVAIGTRTYLDDDELPTWAPLVWVSSDLGTHWQSVTPPAASGYCCIALSKIFQWGGKYTILGYGRVQSNSAIVPLAWTSTNGQGWTVLPSDHTVYTSNAVTAAGDGIRALLRCNSGYATGVGTLSDRATMWSHSNLGAWEKIATTTFDADERNALYAVDDCSDPHILVGRAWVAPGYYAAAAWTYGSPP